MKVSLLVRRWKLKPVFICGSVIAAAMLGWVVLHPENDLGWIPQLPIWPAYILSIPVYFAAGGVHGDSAAIWVYSLIPLNGVGYVLIGMMIQRVYRTLRPQKP